MYQSHDGNYLLRILTIILTIALTIDLMIALMIAPGISERDCKRGYDHNCE